MVLVCKSAVKDDQGRYTVVLKNPKGSDTAYVNVTVNDKPGAPEGPLAVSKITPESCKLEWKAPKVAGCFVVCYLVMFGDNLKLMYSSCSAFG